MSIDTRPPIVWAVQQPTSRDPPGPSMDLSPALEYGRLRFLLRDFQNPFRDLKGTYEALTIASLEMREGDYLLLVGNPILIGIVSVVTARRLRTLRFLQWNRPERRYKLAELAVDPQAAALAPAPAGG